MELDKDAVVAAADLCGRAGASEFEIGYLRDDPADPGWYAHAQYRGARIMTSTHSRPDSAAEELALRLLTGAKCRCGKLVSLSDSGAIALVSPVLADGTRFPLEEAANAGQCRWRREGSSWIPGCPEPESRHEST